MFTILYTFLTENIGTIAVGLVILGIVAAIVGTMIRRRLSGRPPIGCDCAGCAGCSGCAAKK
ncbi:MAG: FeoB-associated Cys-rich membrane protein [Clostridiales bacterium]|jgi:hypothetical protein|nr:FeoB-associated Cys-rich membrane protein [Clostridiales bacterium]